MNTTLAGKTSALCMFLAVITSTGTGSQTTFKSPDEAANALVAAVESGDYPLFLSIAGSKMAGFWSTGDAERDAMERDTFLEAVRKSGIKTRTARAGHEVLYLGDPVQPFPAPLVLTDTGWRFDGEAGLAELTTRRILRDEIAIVEACRRFREAEYTYLRLAHDGAPAFTERIRSAPGRHDGLFWSEEGGEDESPLGPPFASAARAEWQVMEQSRPLFGYYVKILTAQGPNALGGAFDYHTNGRLHKGFALIAWPAEYGVGGLGSFMINHFGDIYRKDLGPQTARLAENMRVFDPDPSWRRFTAYE